MELIENLPPRVDSYSQVGKVNAMTSRRSLVAGLITLCGGAIAAGAALPWVDADGTRPASGITHTAFGGLRHLTYAHSAVATSFAVVVATAGALVFVGGLAASRLLTGSFSVIALATAALWIYLNAHHYRPTDLRYNDLRLGAWLTIAGGLIAAVATIRLRRKDASSDVAPWESLAALADSGRHPSEVKGDRRGWTPDSSARPRPRHPGGNQATRSA